jgi:hypothetical protein
MEQRRMKLIFANTLQILLVAALFGNTVSAQEAVQPQRQGKERNGASQRYEINQTFDGQAFRKDNNVWVYTKEFADLFGMPAKYIEDVQGIAAAAFRIEDMSYQRCGFGGKADACQKVEQCLIDLYFDESKTPLPWVTETKSQWLPWNSSMRWLRTGKPNPALRGEIPNGVVVNETLYPTLIPFADPVSKRQAIFTSNAGVSGGEDAISGSMALIGYTRDFYKSLSVVNLQFGCMPTATRSINIRLDAKKSGAFEAPVARFNKILLSEGFVRRIGELQKANSDRNAVFYRSLFPPPLGTKGVTDITPATPKQ